MCPNGLLRLGLIYGSDRCLSNPWDDIDNIDGGYDNNVDDAGGGDNGDGGDNNDDGGGGDGGADGGDDGDDGEDVLLFIFPLPEASLGNSGVLVN